MTRIAKARKAIGIALTIGGLANCGGGGNSVTSAAPSTLVGVASLTGSDAQVQNLVTIAGERDGNALSLNFDGYDFEASEGFEANGLGIVRAAEDTPPGFLTAVSLPTVTDLTLFDGFYVSEGEGTSIFYGLSGTKPSQSLPSNGSGSWNGSGFIQIVDATGTNNRLLGNAVVTAASGGLLSAEITNLGGDLDTVNLDDMSVSGDRFSGNTITTTKDGGTVDVVGGNPMGAVSGIFSGATVNGAPDEVGGLFTLTGNTATLVGGFVAD